MKILIIGSVASGKTTISKKISKILNTKCYEIDSIVHDDVNKIKRTQEEQFEIITKINKNEKWIIEGTLRKNLYFLLEIADKVIYLDIPKSVRKINIIKRFIKQKLHKEKCNYKPSIKMLKNMFEWTSQFEKDKSYFEEHIENYSRKLIVLKNKKEIEKYITNLEDIEGGKI